MFRDVGSLSRSVCSLELGEILSRAEPPPCPCEDDASHPLVSARVPERALELAAHGRGEGVETIRATERYPRHRPLPVDGDLFVRHRHSSSSNSPSGMRSEERRVGKECRSRW